ncbi:hypothetical protein RZS08_56275, partial [Arthrospira platensis SPKY1]|nr:hypothetical protein [Arthrospira platensis SPKY1]
RRDGSRMADADGGAHAEFLLGRLDHLGHGLDRVGIAVAGRRPAPADELATIFVEGDHLDLGAAQIDADGDGHAGLLSSFAKPLVIGTAPL